MLLNSKKIKIESDKINERNYQIENRFQILTNVI